MKWLSISEEIFAAQSDIASANVDDMDMLKKMVTTTPNKRIRICAHQKSDDRLHEMLIVINQESYIRPHKHLNKGESFHIIEGMLDVVIFHDDGRIHTVIEMGGATSGKDFYYRLSAPYFHTLILKTEWVVFHETTNGPFLKDETVYADWSPEPGDLSLVNQFKKNLEIQIGKYCENISRSYA